jgi:hypothetical protein
MTTLGHQVNSLGLRIGGADVAVHPGAQRICQGQRVAVVLVRMFLGVVFADVLFYSADFIRV